MEKFGNFLLIIRKIIFFLSICEIFIKFDYGLVYKWSLSKYYDMMLYRLLFDYNIIRWGIISKGKNLFVFFYIFGGKKVFLNNLLI